MTFCAICILHRVGGWWSANRIWRPPPWVLCARPAAPPCHWRKQPKGSLSKILIFHCTRSRFKVNLFSCKSTLIRVTCSFYPPGSKGSQLRPLTNKNGQAAPLPLAQTTQSQGIIVQNIDISSSAKLSRLMSFTDFTDWYFTKYMVKVQGQCPWYFISSTRMKVICQF